MSFAAKNPLPTSSRGRGSATSTSRGRTLSSTSARSVTASQRSAAPSSPKSNGNTHKTSVGSVTTSSTKPMNGKDEKTKSVMSKSMTSATAMERAKPRPGFKPKTGLSSSSMTTSLHQNKSGSNCQVENIRQESAQTKKVSVPRPTPIPRQRTVSTKTTPMAKKKMGGAAGGVQHSDHEDEEEETEDIHPALLKQTRKSGSLNL